MQLPLGSGGHQLVPSVWLSRGEGFGFRVSGLGSGVSCLGFGGFRVSRFVIIRTSKTIPEICRRFGIRGFDMFSEFVAYLSDGSANARTFCG